MFDAPYASAGDLAREALQLLLPPVRESVDEYALHRLLPAKSGIGTVPWRHEEAPYLVAPMKALTSYLYTTVAIAGPAQTGKTAVGENALLHAVVRSPRNTLWYMQTDEGVEAYVKKIINQMIRMHPKMLERLGDRPEDNAQHFKRFDGMVVEFLSATDSNLINKNAPLIVADEYDAYDQSLGDPKSRLDTRRQYYGRLSKLLCMSHPDRATGLDPVKHWQHGIMRVIADSTRFVWYWPCPSCGAWSSPYPTAKRYMALDYPKDGTLDEIQREAHLACPVNGCIVEDKHRRAMNLAAYRHPGLFHGYLGAGQEIDEDGKVSGALIPYDTAGFLIAGVMSPFLLNGIGGLARELVKAEREFEVSGDDTTVKEVTVKGIGFPYTVVGPVGSIDAETLAERAKDEVQPLGVVPEGVRFLTCWLDVQAAHFEILVRGWGEGAESWVIAKRRVPADTSTDNDAWYKLLSELAVERFPLATDSSRGMAIRMLGYDSQGQPGVWDRATECWRRLRKNGLVRNYGTLDGRDVWSVIPTQGTPSSKTETPRLQVVYPDNQRKDKKVALRGIVPVARFNANQFKDNLAGQLHHMLPGPGYVHIPAALRSKEAPHVNFEQLVSEKRDAIGRWEKAHSGVRNEMLDLMVGCHVLAHLMGLARINWASPPAWAAPWDKNSTIAAQGEAPVKGRGEVKAEPRLTIADLMKKKPK
jgi:phage terminase large subunit GpA-like protein